MADIPIHFRKSAEGSIASYDYFDIAEGTGAKTLYGFTSDQLGTQNFHLTGDTPFSDEVFTSGAEATGAGEVNIDKDFDLSEFNLPKTINGVAWATIPWCMNVSGLQTASGAIWVTLRKWDGTTETDIASGASATGYLDNSGGAPILQNFFLSTVRMPISSKVSFKKGDTLRVTVQGIIEAYSGGPNTSIWVAHDPQNRDGETGSFDVGVNIDTTTLKVNVPFDLDL